MPQKAYAIELEEISKQFRGAKEPAVHRTDLKIETGQFITIVGTSGCGKTTLLKMVNRLYQPSTGTIWINGEDVTKQSPVLLRRKMGYVIQQTGLFNHMTIEQNVATVPRILGWDKKRISQRVDELLRLVKLEPVEFRKRYPRELSGGQQQRVGIARAMAADPSIMLMDEPFGAIDAINRAALQDELLRIQKQLHKTVLFVTHDIAEAFKLGDKVVIMNNGQIEQFDKPLTILRHPASDFVRFLVKSDDILQRMEFIKAQDIMDTDLTQIEDDDLPIFHPEDSLRDILAALLHENVTDVLIKGQQEQIVGKISYQDLKKI